MEISVLIPTYQRPDYLRSALSSVAAQSRQDLIREVIVSENSSDELSRSVCKEFPTLPVRHVNRLPALTPLEHFETLVGEAKSPWVAWIADDDMWGRYHLSEAQRLLAQRPAAIAFAGACTMVGDETWQLPQGYGLSLESLMPPNPPFADHTVWDAKRIFIESILRTPLNLWGAVCQTPHLKTAVNRWRQSQPSWCNDRIFWCQLAQCGPIVVGHELTLFARYHLGGASSGYSQNKAAWDAGSAAVNREILQMAKQAGIDLKTAWNIAWKQLSPENKQRYLHNCLPGAVANLQASWSEEFVLEFKSKGMLYNLKHWSRQLCPPVLWRGLAGFRRGKR